MVTPRNHHTATLLLDGRVLVAGGISDDLVAQAELYDPITSTWTATGAMAGGRYGHTATLLFDGRVLVTGGLFAGSDNPVASAELYDAETGLWTVTGSMKGPRTLHTATLLPDGRVLIAGGSQYNTEGGALASAELYDPDRGTWTAAKSMDEARYGHTVTPLVEGMFLVAGGFPGGGGVSPVPQILDSAELYDYRRGTWSATGTMDSARGKHEATSLPDGNVLVVGLGPLRSAEVYDVESGRWSATGRMADARFAFAMTSLPDGRVLVAGGYGNDDAGLLASAELYDPAGRDWKVIDDMIAPRQDHTATILSNGDVLVAGGSEDQQVSAEVYHPSAGS